MGEVANRIGRLSVAQRTLLEMRLTELGLDKAMRAPPRSDSMKTLARNTVIADSFSDAGRDFPTVVHAPAPRADLIGWIEKNRAWLEDALQKSGAILVREFLIEGPTAFEQCIEQAWGASTDYPGFTQSVALRKHVSGKIYTSTEYSPAFRIHLHNECAFANTWPAQICFFCVTAPSSGGETPIADSRRVLERISQTTLSRLLERGILYVRNFSYGSSRSWERAFGTTDKARVEEICRAERVACEWLDDSRLRTRAVRPPVARHPTTGEPVWFNHINASHISSLEPDLRNALLAEFQPEDLPRNCYYGDGSEIEHSVIEEIRHAYEAETVTFDWKPGDLLMADNMLTAHGRHPFTGEREILVGMAGSIQRADD